MLIFLDYVNLTFLAYSEVYIDMTLMIQDKNTFTMDGMCYLHWVLQITKMTNSNFRFCVTGHVGRNFSSIKLAIYFRHKSNTAQAVLISY